MKKMITLAALILSVAMVSNVDARERGVAKKTTRRAAVNAADVLNAAKNLTDAKQAASPEMPVTQQPAVQQAAKVAVAVLTDPDMTAKQQELVQKRIKKADLERSRTLKQDEIKDIGYGWFGFGTTDEQKKNYREAKADLAKINADLKEVNARIRELEVATGKAWSGAVRAGIAALATVGIIGTAYGVDQYILGGEYTEAVKGFARTAYETAEQYFPGAAGRAAAREAAEEEANVRALEREQRNRIVGM